MNECNFNPDGKHMYSTNFFTGRMSCLCGAVLLSITERRYKYNE